MRACTVIDRQYPQLPHKRIRTDGKMRCIIRDGLAEIFERLGAALLKSGSSSVLTAYNSTILK